jgi:MazG family protein
MSSYQELKSIIHKLRDPETGCSWDKAQTSKSLVPNFIEELYETVEAIEENNVTDLKEELGDLLMHVLMQIQIAEEKEDFTDQDVFHGICQKLIRRHPHIFEDENVESVKDIKYNWERIKLEEKKKTRTSVLEGIPKRMPALIVAFRMQEKAASVGFDWDDWKPVLAKIKEETEEILEAIELQDKEHLEGEIGDLLFATVNLARHFEIDAELALRKTIEKFESRFKKIENYHTENNLNIYESSLEKMDEIWNLAKQSEKK